MTENTVTRGAAQADAIFWVKELDNALKGALRQGRVYVIYGDTGAGMTTLCTQFLVGGARQGEKGAIILTSTRGEEYIANAKTFSFGFEDYYKKGTIEVIELSDRNKEMRPEPIEDYKTSKKYISELTGEIKKIVFESDIKRVAIDPITPMIVENDDFIIQFFNALADAVPQTYLFVTSGVKKRDIDEFGSIGDHASGIIQLKRGNDGGKEFTIVKMRGSSYDGSTIPYTITSDGIVPSKADDKFSSDPIFKRVV